MTIKNPMSLKQFMLRGQVLKLYRDILRCIRTLPNVQDQQEMRTWARHDFKNNRHHTDEEVIRMTITRGRQQLRELEKMANLSR